MSDAKKFGLGRAQKEEGDGTAPRQGLKSASQAGKTSAELRVLLSALRRCRDAALFRSRDSLHLRRASIARPPSSERGGVRQETVAAHLTIRIPSHLPTTVGRRGTNRVLRVLATSNPPRRHTRLPAPRREHSLRNRTTWPTSPHFADGLPDALSRHYECHLMLFEVSSNIHQSQPVDRARTPSEVKALTALLNHPSTTHLSGPC